MVYAAASFSESVTSWCLRNDTQNFTSVILCMKIIFIEHWLFGGNSENEQCYDVFARRQKLCKPESIFKQTRVNFFYSINMTSFLNYVTAMLRALFAWRGSFGDLIVWIRYAFSQNWTSNTVYLYSEIARCGGVEVAGCTVDRTIRVRFPACPKRMWVLCWQGGKRRLWTSRCPLRSRLGTANDP